MSASLVPTAAAFVEDQTNLVLGEKLLATRATTYPLGGMVNEGLNSTMMTPMSVPDSPDITISSIKMGGLESS
jgi:hypothetical protein